MLFNHPETKKNLIVVSVSVLALLLLFPTVTSPLISYTATISMSILSNSYNFFVDNNLSNLDSISDKGLHSNFTAQQYGPNSIYDTLTEQTETSGSIEIEDYVDNNLSDVDSSADIGVHSDFSSQQTGPDSVYDTLTEENTGGDPTTFGKTDIGLGSRGFTGYLEASRYQCEQDGVATQITLYLTGGAPGRYARVAIYSDNSGAPGSLLGESTAQETASDGWHVFTGFNVPVSENTYYWLAFQISTSNLNYHYDTGLANQHAYRSFAYGSFPSSFGSPSYTAEAQSIYLTSSATNFEIDLEVQWTDAYYNQTNEELCIFFNSVSGGSNNTYSLDATGGYMIVGDGTPDWGSTSGTISFWVKWNAFGGRPWGQHNDMEIVNSGSSLIIDWGTSGDITSSSFVAGTWYFIAITWNENANVLSLYVGDQNNAPTLDAQNSAWFATVSMLGVTQNCFMNSRGSFYQVDGHGDDLRYYNTDRSLVEIQSDYDLELSGSESNLRAYFKLNNDFDDVGPDDADGSGSGSFSFSTDTPFTSVATENLKVDVWTGATWQNVITNLSNGWNNVSITDWLTTSTFTIRFSDGTKTGDSNPDTWQIDITLIRVSSQEADNFEIDLEVQWTDAYYNQTNEELCIFFNSVSGGSNNTYSLDATGGYMIVGDGTPDWGSTSGTISFWVKWDTLANRPWGQHTNMEIRISGTNLVIDWGGTTSLTSTTGFITGNWYFIAIVWNESTNELLLYVGDENNAPTVDSSTGSWFSTVSTLGVTENNFMNARAGLYQVDGHGDDLRYYNTDRSLVEIQSDYDLELSGSESNLRAYFKLNNDFDDVGPDDADGSGSGSFSFSTDTPFTSVATENLKVDVWTGATWQNVITNLSNGWNNATVSSYLTSMPFTIRFRDDIKNSDGTQDSWNIDATLLHVWS